MKRFIILICSLFLTVGLSAQGFPKAEKQPKMKEQHHNQKKFAKRAHRRHVKRGTAYMPDSLKPNGLIWLCILTDGLGAQEDIFNHAITTA